MKRLFCVGNIFTIKSYQMKLLSVFTIIAAISLAPCKRPVKMSLESSSKRGTEIHSTNQIMFNDAYALEPGPILRRFL
jgi:hypothetical protein